MVPKQPEIPGKQQFKQVHTRLYYVHTMRTRVHTCLYKVQSITQLYVLCTYTYVQVHNCTNMYVHVQQMYRHKHQ